MASPTIPTTAPPGGRDPRADTATFHALVRRLSEQSVRKHFDAYVDVPWDEHPLDPTDVRWELGDDDLLARTDWYRSLPQETRARIGLFSVAAKMKTGLQFENVLCRGVLEFVNRSGIDVAGMPLDARIRSCFVVLLGRVFPELFFMFVLGGEDPKVRKLAVELGLCGPMARRLWRRRGIWADEGSGATPG